MKKIKSIESRMIVLLSIFLACPLGRGAGQPGMDFVVPPRNPPKLELQVVKGEYLNKLTILAPTKMNQDRVTAVMEIRSPKIVVADLLTRGWCKKAQNKYLKLGMWISIPVDPENPDSKKHTVKMLFTNIDIYVDAGADKRRLPFNIKDPFVLDSYKAKGLTPPKPVVFQFDVSELETYAAEVKGNYLIRQLRQDPDYVEVPGFYYLVPKENPDWDAIKAEAARAGKPRSFEDFIIDGTLFGTWYPMEHLEKTGEAAVSKAGPGMYRLEVRSWPSDDKFHVGF